MSAMNWRRPSSIRSYRIDEAAERGRYQHYMSRKLNRRNVRQFRATHYVSAIWSVCRADDEGLAQIASTTSLRAQRSNPGSFRDDSLDCFVASAPRNDADHGDRRPHGISYTTILSAMPRSAACFWIGLISRCLRTSATAGASSTGPVMWISCAVERLCTRAAMLTVWPK